VTLCDPACGSGAFLIAAYDWFLNHRLSLLDDLSHVEPGDPDCAGSHDDWIERSAPLILQNNLYGVDISPESVEIAQLSLWIRTARPGKPLTDLSAHIRCGNSVIDDRNVDTKAFHWLDAARYADTHGYHFDNYREMWSYRDWVISAFNRNLAFEQFTIEQLAGDLLPGRTLDQQIASGFNRCNMTTNEGGTIPEENLVSYTRDRTETVSQVWLGLTANCAVCHDHKFDPLTQREFYEMSAFFNNTTQGALDGNIKDTPPSVFVPSAADRDRWSTLLADLGALRTRIESRTAAARPEFAKWLTGQTRDSLTALIPARELRLNLGSSPRDDAAPGGAQSQIRPIFESADSGDFERKDAFSFGAWIKLPKSGLFGSVVARMDDQHDYRGWDLWIEDRKVATHLVNKWPENALKVVGRAELPLNIWTHVLVTYDSSSQAAGVKIYINGELQDTEIAANQLNNTIRTSVPLKVGQRHTSARLDDVGISDVRIYRLALTADEAADLAAAGRALALLGKPMQQRPREDTEALLIWWLKTRDPGSKALQARHHALQKEEAAIRSRGTVAHVMQERTEPAIAGSRSATKAWTSALLASSRHAWCRRCWPDPTCLRTTQPPVSRRPTGGALHAQAGKRTPRPALRWRGSAVITGSPCTPSPVAAAVRLMKPRTSSKVFSPTCRNEVL